MNKKCKSNFLLDYIHIEISVFNCDKISRIHLNPGVNDRGLQSKDELTQRQLDRGGGCLQLVVVRAEGCHHLRGRELSGHGVGRSPPF